MGEMKLNGLQKKWAVRNYVTIYINPRHIGGATIRSYSENPELYNDMAKKESVKFIKQRIREREKQGYNQRDIKML